MRPKILVAWIAHDHSCHLGCRLNTQGLVLELVTDWLPSFPAVMGTLYQLPKQSAVLGGVKPLWAGWRSLQMDYFPAW